MYSGGIYATLCFMPPLCFMLPLYYLLQSILEISALISI